MQIKLIQSESHTKFQTESHPKILLKSSTNEPNKIRSTPSLQTYKGIKVRHLELFNAIVEHHTLHKAAEVLQVTQPAASKSIAELENILGVELFTRTKKGMCLTSYGEVLKRHSASFMSNLAEMTREIRQMHQGTVGLIRLGFVPSLDPELLSVIISEALKEFPEIQIRTVEGPTNQLLASMDRNEIDLILGRILDVQIAKFYRVLPVYRESFAIVCSNKNMQINIKTADWSTLSNGRWILPAMQTPFREMIDHLFTQQSVLRPNVVVESSSFEKIQKLISNTDLLGILPTSLALQGKKNGTLKVLMPNLGENFAPISLIYRKETELAPLTKNFVRLISDLDINLCN
jgi:DNA-binding transcriptional LysR family regulator